MVVQDKTYLSFEEFLEQEAKAERRSEYFRGQIIPKISETLEHNTLCINFVSVINRASRNKPFEIFALDLIVWLREYQQAVYPDTMIVEGDLELLENHNNVLLNPTVIIEVLSPSTEAYDRGDKFKLYRSLPSFREYVLISQNVMHVDQFVKTKDGDWLLSDVNGEESILRLKTVPFEIALKDLYDKVNFEVTESVADE